MRIGETIREVMHGLREQRSRSIFSALGIAIASLAIVTLMSIAIGVKADIKSQVEDLGVNVLIVIPGRFEEGNFNPNLGGQSFLKEEFAAELKQQPGVVETTPLTFCGGGVQYNGKDAYPFVIAIENVWFNIHQEKLVYGKFWADRNSTEQVAVIGSKAATTIFGDVKTALGKTLTINSKPYQIIGVTEEKDSKQTMFSMLALQNVVYIPFHSFAKGNSSYQVDRIMVQASPDTEPKALVKGLEDVLGKHLQHQQYSVITQEDLLKMVFKLMGILSWLVIGLSSIALLVGGVGIMTVMLMSINERTREIGIRKAFGAKYRDVFRQFLYETIALSLLGGLAGLAASYLICLALYRYTDVKPMITSGVLATCLGVCAGVGTLFGLLPALRAARQDPVDAMRNE